jgi:hypothetical protein
MILVSLPLPPLPVLVVRGEDLTTSVCSSHDLHAAMISTQHVGNWRVKFKIALGYKSAHRS